jgi:hypothetical protein
MFRFIGTLIKLVTMVSTLMVAIEQIRSVMGKRKAAGSESFTDTSRAA